MAWKSFFYKNLHFKKVYKRFWHPRKEEREEEADANGQVPVRRKGIFQAWAHFQEVREFLSGSSRKKDHSTLKAKVTVEKSDSSHLISMSCHNWLWSRKYLVFWKYCSTKNWFLRWHSEKSIYQCRRCRFDPWVGKIPWRRKWLPTPVLLPWKSYGQRSLVQATTHGVTKSQKQLSD